MTADELARHATVGLVVVRDGAVTRLNDAARALVEPHGGRWTGPGSPLGPLAELRPGSRRVAVRWPSPTGGTRWWEVTRSPLPGGGASHLFEIVDDTGRTRPTAATPARPPRSDVTEQHRVLQELAFLAENDPPTGIANRRRISGMLVDCAYDPLGAAADRHRQRQEHQRPAGSRGRGTA